MYVSAISRSLGLIGEGLCAFKLYQRESLSLYQSGLVILHHCDSYDDGMADGMILIDSKSLRRRHASEPSECENRRAEPLMR